MQDPTHIAGQADRIWPDPASPDAPKSATLDLRSGGTLARTLPGYQERGSQIEMAMLIEQAIAEDTHALLEASTGTGKSLSYLLPLIGSGKKAIESTANKALQEQLFRKMCPFASSTFKTLRPLLSKARATTSVNSASDQEQGMRVQDLAFKRIEKAVDETAWNGDFETLPFVVAGDIRARISVDGDGVLEESAHSLKTAITTRCVNRPNMHKLSLPTMISSCSMPRAATNCSHHMTWLL